MSGYAFEFNGHGTFTPDGPADEIAGVSAHNAEVEREELAVWQAKPEQWQVYVSAPGGGIGGVGRKVTTWLGTELGTITYSSTYLHNFGSRMTAIRFKGTNGATYSGRYGSDWSQLCRVRKVKE